MTNGELNPEDYKCIQENFTYLKKNLDARRIVDFLFQNSVLTWEEKEKITKTKTRSKRNEKLLKRILHAGPGAAFNMFLKSLEQEHKHVLEHLKKIKQDEGKPCCTCKHHNETIERMQQEIEEKDELLKKYTFAVQKIEDEKEIKRPNIFIAFFKSIHIHKHGDNDKVTTETIQQCHCLALTDSDDVTYRFRPRPLPAIKRK